MRAPGLLLALLAGCVPVEVARAPDGTLAYPATGGYAVLPAGGGEARTHPVPWIEEDDTWWVAWSPDGKRLAFTGDAGEGHALGLLDPAQGEVRKLAVHEGDLYLPRWSPDGTRISYVVVRDEDAGEGESKRHHSELRLLDVESGKSRILARACALAHAWAPGGGSIYAVLAEGGVLPEEKGAGTVAAVDVATGAATPVAPVVFSLFAHVRYGHRRLWISAPPDRESPHVLYAIDLDGEGAAKLVSAPGEEVSYSAGSPSGARTAYVAGEGVKGPVVVLGKGLEPKRVGRSSGQLLPFWLDEQRVVFATGDREEPRIVVHDLSRGETRDHPLPGIRLP